MSHKSRMGCRAVLVLILLAVFPVVSVFAKSQREDAVEKEVVDGLRAINPQAAELFVQATREMDDEKPQEAEKTYREVLRLVPDHSATLRRLSYVVKKPEEAIELARYAMRLDPHAFNKVAVARALSQVRADPNHRAEALRLAHEASHELPGDASLQTGVCQISLVYDDMPLFRQALQRLAAAEPDSMFAHYFSGIRAAVDSEWEIAEAELLEAQKLGLPVEAIQAILRDSGIQSSARQGRYLRYSLYGLAGWAVGLVVLFVTGGILSAMTLSTVRRNNVQLTGDATGVSRLMRRIYAVILTLTSLYFYVSIPIILLLVVGIGGGLIYAFFAAGRVPIKLVVLVVIVVLFTFWAVLKSLFVRVRDEDPGRRLSESEAPGLFAMMREVAARIGTPMVDMVFLVPDATAAVFERGSFWRRLSGRTERCMILGLGVLEGMTQLQLKAILAHEFGHLVNKDTAGGGLALHARRTLENTALALAQNGAAGWYNPAWLFLLFYHRVYLRVSQGASRLQEILADRRAVLLCGSQAFIEGLRRVIRRSVEFSLLANLEIHGATHQKRGLANLYQLAIPDAWPDFIHPQDLRGEDGTSPETPAALIEKNYRQAIEHQTSVYDSHPAPQQRFELVRDLPNLPDIADDGRPAWELLKDPAGFQEEMTRQVDENVKTAIV